MDEFDIPIFKKVYDLYKTVHHIRASVPKQDRHTLWQRCEDTSLDIIEGILQATSMPRTEKVPVLNKVSIKLNLLRIFARLSHDTKSIDVMKYTSLQEIMDEIGRMLGGWIKSSKQQKD
ncbi:MAG: diversity-generating retroelement protein Avd [Patescibacteria group bacterium]|nr:diversity-generating retroelement protein Avd [Patescibacteria group bacterium]